jgi:hypothetical protein
MLDLHTTTHALARCGQRGIGVRDAELAVLLGVEVEGGFLLMQRQCAAAARNFRCLADRLDRLAGTRVVAEGNAVVTAYRTTRRKQRRLLRWAEERNLED